MGILVQPRALLYCSLSLLMAVLVGCAADNEVGVTLRGDEELSPGSSVPFTFGPPVSDARGVAVVGYQVAKTMRLQLRIYGEDWQEITLVFDEKLRPGRYERRVNIESLAQGTYYCVMEGDGYTIIQKLPVWK